jgi:hypothetical protein
MIKRTIEREQAQHTIRSKRQRRSTEFLTRFEGPGVPHLEVIELPGGAEKAPSELLLDSFPTSTDLLLEADDLRVFCCGEFDPHGDGMGVTKRREVK